jgi:uncharacterized membrane protein
MPPDSDPPQQPASEIERLKGEIAQLKDEKLIGAIDKLDSKFKGLEERLRTAEGKIAEKEGSRKATAWWAAGVAAMIAFFLGYNSFWALPKAVNAEVAQQIPAAVKHEVEQHVPAEVKNLVDSLHASSKEATQSVKEAKDAADLASKDAGEISRRLERIDDFADEIRVPLGTMLPYFAAALPKDGRWVWADGKKTWPDDASWVPEGLKGKPVPDMTKGLLVGGSTPDVSVGEVWNKGVLTVPASNVSGSVFSIASVADERPLGPGSEQSAINSKFPYPFFYYLLDKTRPIERDRAITPADVTQSDVNNIAATGVGPRPFGRGHPNPVTQAARFNYLTDDPYFISLAVDLHHFAKAGPSISGATSFKDINIQMNTSAGNPPFVTARWIIRIKYWSFHNLGDI